MIIINRFHNYYKVAIFIKILTMNKFLDIEKSTSIPRGFETDSLSKTACVKFYPTRSIRQVWRLIQIEPSS